MNYWGAKSDLAFMVAFHEDVKEMWERVDAYANWRSQNPRHMGAGPNVEDDLDYQAVRARIARGMNRAERIARRLRVGYTMSVILHDGRYARPRQELTDALNRTVGACDHEMHAERRHVWNPLWWLFQGPFLALQSAGIDTARFEAKWWSRALVQITFDLIAALIAGLLLFALGVGR